MTAKALEDAGHMLYRSRARSEATGAGSIQSKV